MSTKGQTRYDCIDYRSGDTLLFGPETRGLPADLLQSLGPQQTVRIPMRGDSRSLNLSNAVAILVYEGLRQLQFTGMD